MSSKSVLTDPLSIRACCLNAATPPVAAKIQEARMFHVHDRYLDTYKEYENDLAAVTREELDNNAGQWLCPDSDFIWANIGCPSIRRHGLCRRHTTA